VGIEGTMDYLTSLGSVDMNDLSLLIALEIIQAPCLGTMKKSSFVEGWKSAG
jgi:DCN1-like protein 1/2